MWWSIHTLGVLLLNSTHLSSNFQPLLLFHVHRVAGSSYSSFFPFPWLITRPLGTHLDLLIGLIGQSNRLQTRSLVKQPSPLTNRLLLNLWRGESQPRGCGDPLPAVSEKLRSWMLVCFILYAAWYLFLVVIRVTTLDDEPISVGSDGDTCFKVIYNSQDS